MTTDTMGHRLALPVRAIDTEAPWAWLAAGWRDLWRAPGVGLVYGTIFAAASYAIAIGLIKLDLLALLLPLAAGFALLAPFLAVGVYEASRRFETGEPVGFWATALAWRRAPGQLLLAGALLMLFFLVWVRVATLLFALFFGFGEIAPDAFATVLLFTPKGLVFLMIGSVTGALLALAVFAIAAVSIPLILDRDTFVVAAIATSVVAVGRNFGPMLLWGMLISLFIAAGIVTLFLGLIVIFPLLGHATWHAYRALVPREIGGAA